MFDFLTIRKSIAALQQRHDQLQLDNQNLERQLSQVQGAPSNKSDIKKIVDNWITNSTSGFAKAVEALVTAECRNDKSCSLQSFGFFSLVAEQGGARFDSGQLDGAMCAVFGPQIKQAIHAVIDTMDWPSEGLPREKRLAEIERIQQQILANTNELEGLRTEAHAAGVTFK